MHDTKPICRLALLALLSALPLAGCDQAAANDGEAAAQEPVEMAAGRWQMQGEGKMADALYLGGDRQFCLAAGGTDHLLQPVMDDLVRKELGDDVGQCSSSGIKRTGNLVTNRVACSYPNKGKIAADVKAIVSRDLIDVRYDVDLSGLHDPNTDLSKAKAVMRDDPPRLTIRRLGACTRT